METNLELITPAKAAAYLVFNTKNRPLRKLTVLQYAKDMKAGKWEVHHQGIAFDSDGTLLDGQHRLQAILESQATVEMLVTRGVKASAQVAMDDHAKRTAADAISLIHGKEYTNRQVAIVRCCVETAECTKGDKGRKTKQELNELLVFFERPLEFIGRIPGKNDKGVSAAPVMAAVCMAWFYVHDLEMLERFVLILIGQEMAEGEEEKAVLTLREYMLRGGLKSGGRSIRTEVFRKSQRAIFAFMKRQPLNKLYGSEYLYPWPLTNAVRV